MDSELLVKIKVSVVTMCCGYNMEFSEMCILVNIKE